MSQLEYIAILFNDLGYDTVVKRKDWLRRFNVDYADELSVPLRNQLIEQLLREKEDKKK